ncbi:hypothetical protein D7D52_27140 [Nocardia yunnanensis]|uniref:Uncharacterized protein n=1 Tax=Nocardia yunnanensis TaxID=2382165 RepID=A0A386ZG43_9NOCA|nr:hypothetical protein [Nocardia yunnanensis]AYF76872.1 hypothetical protein D7D52_27140 [Nocardia yunnanensis]
MTDSLTMIAIDTLSQLVNSYASEIAGASLPAVSWMWDCRARLDATGADAEFCGTVHPDLAAAESNSQLLTWARALNLTDATDVCDASAGRRVFTGQLGESRIRLTALIESLHPATETQPLIALM